MNLSNPLTFAAGGGEIDRASHLRVRSAELLARPDARLLPQWQDKALIELAGERPALGWVAPGPGLVAEAADAPVFLGCYQGAPCFTADFSALDEDTAKTRFGETMKFIDLRSVAGQLTQAEATIVAAAQGVLGWPRTPTAALFVFGEVDATARGGRNAWSSAVACARGAAAAGKRHPDPVLHRGGRRAAPRHGGLYLLHRNDVGLRHREDLHRRRRQRLDRS